MQRYLTVGAFKATRPKSTVKRQRSEVVVTKPVGRKKKTSGKKAKAAKPQSKTKTSGNKASKTQSNTNTTVESQGYTTSNQGDLSKSQKCEDGKLRCWGKTPGSVRDYHDFTWGRPCADAQELFGHLTLQSFQSGLSWTTILNKWDGFRDAFCDWDFNAVAEFTEADFNRLMNNTAIVRNRLKIRAAINNANVIRELESSFPGGFVGWMWSFDVPDSERYMQRYLKSHMRSDFKIKAKDRFHADGVHPTASIAAATKEAKKLGFKFLGETTMLSLWQVMGLVNHHKKDCFAFREAEKAFHELKKTLR